VRILEYAREVGIDRALPEAAFAVPNESARYLDRDELVRFGIDRREFGETAWHFAEGPAAAIYKRFFIRTDNGDQPHYRNGYVRLDYCGARVQIGFAFAQERASSEKFADLLVDLNGQRVILPYLAQTSQFLVNSTSLSRESFDLLGQAPNIKVSGFDQGEKGRSPRSVTLSMDGFSEASVKLRTSCADPKDATAYYGRGTTSYAKGEYDRAVEDYSEAIRIDPKYALAYIGRGTAWRAKGEYDRAIADHSEAVRLDPKDARAYNNRGTAWYAKGEYDRAIADYNEAIRLDPAYATAYYGRGTTSYAKGEYDRAIVDYNEAIRLDPKDATAYVGRGAAWPFKGEYDRAIADYNEAVRLDPKDAKAYIGRGAAWHGKAEYDRAIADHSKAIRLDPKNVEAYLDRGTAWRAKGEYDRAIADYNEAARLDPKDARPHIGRGIANLYSGSLPEALVDLKSRSPQAIAQIDMAKWPAPVIRLFLGPLTRADVLAAADTPDATRKRGQLCVANFFSGELALQQGAKEDATRLFRLAAADCPKNLAQWAAAKAELKALGLTP
jgi:tetratricopeptide (TPR) repeat protein